MALPLCKNECPSSASGFGKSHEAGNGAKVTDISNLGNCQKQEDWVELSSFVSVRKQVIALLGLVMTSGQGGGWDPQGHLLWEARCLMSFDVT